MYNDIDKQWIGFTYMWCSLIQLITQRAVDNNLGPDRLAGPRALYLNYCRQQTQVVPFLGQGIPPAHTNNFAHQT